VLYCIGLYAYSHTLHPPASNRGDACEGCQKLVFVLQYGIVCIFSHPTHTCVHRDAVCVGKGLYVLLHCISRVSCSVLQRCSVLQYGAVCCSVMHCISQVCSHNMVQCVAVCCSVLQCVAACMSFSLIIRSRLQCERRTHGK